VTEFVVELYIAETDRDSAQRGANDARFAAEAITREGTPVRFLRSIFVPEDETCFLMFEAASIDTVRDTARRAALPFERVTEAVVEPRQEATTPTGSPTRTETAHP
jgi:hypothetical protein